MKKTGRRRLMSVGMTFVLALGMMPLGFLGGKTEVTATEVKPEDTTVLVFNASEMPEGDITSETVAGDFILRASSDKKLTVDANQKTNEDGSVSFTRRLKSNGKSGDSDRTITFTTGGAGTATVYMISSNKEEADRSLSLHYAESGEMVEGASWYAPVSASEDGKITPVEYPIPEAGTYKFMASQGINIYYIEVVYSGSAVTGVERKDWNDVPEPVINSVSINDKGTIDVDVTVEIGIDGADTARLFLMQNGYEAISTQVTESGVYTFEPSIKGDFDVRAIMCRKGCIDKESNKVKVSDYKLPMPKPVINWLDNLGDGEVYVDWMNTGAQKYEVSYREAGSKDFKVAASDLTEGDYTITGLTEGKIYEIRVKATDEDRTAEDSKSITVGAPKQQWYIAAIGSATSGVIAVDGTEYKIISEDGVVEVNDVTENGGKIGIASQTNGKIADSEDGVFYYFTRIKPDTENFKLTATYTVTDVKDGPDNQTGYGIFAMDIAGIGSKDAKYFNSVSVGQFKMYNNGYHGNGTRLISGYTSYDAYNLDGAVRDHNNKNSFSVVNATDSVQIGDTFTYTLEKTDDGYIASMEGAEETITFDGADCLMVQDDGSICIGVASARKVGVEISDIQFEKSEGKIGTESVRIVEPELSVYSTDITGTTDYEAIASANVEGKLVITAAGKEIYNGDVAANKVVRAATQLPASGTADFVYEFTPDSGILNLSSYDKITVSRNVGFRGIGGVNGVIYVAPDGTAEGKGTKESPMELQSVLDCAGAGLTIVMMDGTYRPAEEYLIGRSVCGTEEHPITLLAEHDGNVVIDGSDIRDNGAVINLVGSYWHIYGLEICNGPTRGIIISGNNNTVEMCRLHHLGTAGVQISRHSDEPNDNRMWPSDNLVKNCDAYDNCDAGRTDADGFAAKLTCGTGNKFYGCISHNNIDDGFDLYAKSTTGPIGEVVIENCVAYSNGFLSGDDPASPDTSFGEGNGFKLGGENMFGAHQLINCIAYNNYNKGITSNSGPNCEVINCTAYNNSLIGTSCNVSLYTKNSNPKAWILTGMLSVADNDTCIGELGAANGVIYSLRSENNYLYDGMESENNQGNNADINWFENTDITVAPTRNANGTIDMHGLLVLTGDAPQNTGARLDITTQNAVSNKPAYSGMVQDSQTSVTVNDDVKVDNGTIPVWVMIVVVVAAILVIGAAVIWYKIHY